MFPSWLQDISNSDWMNSIASVSAVGDVFGIWLPEMVYSYRNMKTFTSRRFVSVVAITFELNTDIRTVYGNDVLRSPLKKGLIYIKVSQQAIPDDTAAAFVSG